MKPTQYLSPAEAAKLIGCSRRTVCRVGKAAGIGVQAGGRLVAFAPEDTDKLRGLVHATSGNPVWIAKRKPPT